MSRYFTYISQTVFSGNRRKLRFAYIVKSEGYLQFEIGKKISSTDFYNIYVSWCEDNLEKPRASAGFLHYIKENQKRYGLIYDAKCIGNRRGFHNVCKAEFT